MARKLFLILFIISTQIFSQPRPLQFTGAVETNLIQVSKDSFYLYVSCRIPCSELIFAKDNNRFISGIRFVSEVFEGDNLTDRKSAEETVEVQSYSETLDENRYIQSLLEFKLGKSKYTIKPSIFRNNTDMEMPFREIELDLVNNEKKVRPVVVLKSVNSNRYTLVNKGNLIPYDDSKYNLLVPLPDSSSGVKIKIEQSGVLLSDTLVASTVRGGARILKEGNSVILALTPGINPLPVSYVRVILPVTIDEGDLQVIIENARKKTIYNLPVVWLKKPVVLNDMDLSIKLLAMIFAPKKVDSLQSQPSSKQYAALKKEWNKLVPPAEGPMNMLMKEFYTRADYAILNFSYNGKMNGALTDRGKVYIQFGKPDNIERNYSNSSGPVEIWYYENLKRDFIFEDTTGKGNYLLRK